MAPLRYRILDTSAGWLGFVASDIGVQRVVLPVAERAVAARMIADAAPAAVEDDSLLPELAEQFEAFLAGRLSDFDIPLDWADASTFERDVWQVCRQIPFGKTVSYKTLAERIGRPGGARAVGMAMANNRTPLLVPCHRVVRADGGLGGFSGPGGIDQKRALLAFEARAAANALVPCGV